MMFGKLAPLAIGAGCLVTTIAASPALMLQNGSANAADAVVLASASPSTTASPAASSVGKTDTGNAVSIDTPVAKTVYKSGESVPLDGSVVGKKGTKTNVIAVIDLSGSTQVAATTSGTGVVTDKYTDTIQYMELMSAKTLEKMYTDPIKVVAFSDKAAVTELPKDPATEGKEWASNLKLGVSTACGNGMNLAQGLVDKTPGVRNIVYLITDGKCTAESQLDENGLPVMGTDGMPIMNAKVDPYPIVGATVYTLEHSPNTTDCTTDSSDWATLSGGKCVSEPDSTKIPTVIGTLATHATKVVVTTTGPNGYKDTQDVTASLAGGTDWTGKALTGLAPGEYTSTVAATYSDGTSAQGVTTFVVEGAATPTPEPTPSETPSETPTPTPEPTPSETPSETPTPTPEPTPSETPSETPTPTPEPTPSETPSETPTPEPTPTPSETPTIEPSASLSIEKYVTSAGREKGDADTLENAFVMNKINHSSYQHKPVNDLEGHYTIAEVGKDIQPGTYKYTVVNPDSNYWGYWEVGQISDSTAFGIIDNDIVNAGDPRTGTFEITDEAEYLKYNKELKIERIGDVTSTPKPETPKVDETKVDITIDIANNGNLPLTDVKLADVAEGDGKVTDLSCGDDKADDKFVVTFKKALEPNASVKCTATITGMDNNLKHSDVATVTAKDPSGTEVKASDALFVNGAVVEETKPTETPKPSVKPTPVVKETPKPTAKATETKEVDEPKNDTTVKVKAGGELTETAGLYTIAGIGLAGVTTALVRRRKK